MSKLTHDDLCNLGGLLGYSNLQYGICHGYAAILMQALLVNEEEIFFQRIGLIASYKGNFLQLKKDIEAAKEKVRSKIELTSDERKVLDILAFYEGLLIYLNPKFYPGLFNNQPIPQQDISTVYSIARSTLLEGTELHTFHRKCYIFDRKKLFTYIFQLSQALQQTAIKLPILISSLTHTVSVNFDCATLKWAFTDVNNFKKNSKKSNYYQTLSNRALVKRLFRSLSEDDETVLLEIAIYERSDRIHLHQPLKKQITDFEVDYDYSPNYLAMYPEQSEKLLFLISNANEPLMLEQLLLSSNGQLNINALYIENFSVLFTACLFGNTAIIEQLLIHPSLDINLRCHTKNTALHIACLYNRLQIVQKMLAHPQINCDLINNDDKTPLQIAGENNHSEIIYELINANLQNKQQLQKRLKAELSRIIMKIKSGKFKSVAAVVESLTASSVATKISNHPYTLSTAIKRKQPCSPRLDLPSKRRPI